MSQSGTHQIIDADGNCIELIHPNHVLKALKAFLQEYRGHQKYAQFDSSKEYNHIICRATSQVQYQVASLDERDDSQDAEYWAQYPNVVDGQRERLWDAFTVGLQKY